MTFAYWLVFIITNAKNAQEKRLPYKKVLKVIR